MPGQIVAVRADWRARLHEFWFWDNPESAVGQDHVLGAVPVADTHVGDELWFHPDDPDTAIVLPRDSDRSYAVGSGLDGAIDWVFSSGVLLEPSGGRLAFESHIGRKHVRRESQSADVTSVRDALLALGLHALVHQFHDKHWVVYFPSIKRTCGADGRQRRCCRVDRARRPRRLVIAHSHPVRARARGGSIRLTPRRAPCSNRDILRTRTFGAALVGRAGLPIPPARRLCTGPVRGAGKPIRRRVAG